MHQSTIIFLIDKSIVLRLEKIKFFQITCRPRKIRNSKEATSIINIIDCSSYLNSPYYVVNNPLNILVVNNHNNTIFIVGLKRRNWKITH